jgi:acylphosphatase
VSKNPDIPEIKTARLHAIVEGRVQGVGFRAFTQRNATILGLCGWVRNRWDGTVEVIAEGPRLEAEKLLNILRRGPFYGTTQNVVFDWYPATGEFSSFRVRMTG